MGSIENHWMKNFYACILLNENIKTHENYENYCYDVTYGLWVFFNKSTFLFNMFAILFQNISNYEQSISFFQKIQ